MSKKNAPRRFIISIQTSLYGGYVKHASSLLTDLMIKLGCSDPWLSRLERRIHIAKVRGSNPLGSTNPVHISKTFSDRIIYLILLLILDSYKCKVIIRLSFLGIVQNGFYNLLTQILCKQI